jgi:hypothetical protein
VFGKYCLHICVFTFRQGIEMKQNTEYSSESVLCFDTSFFQVVIQCCQRRTSFLNLLVYSSSGCSCNHIFITCEMNSFEMFLERCENQKCDGAKSRLEGGCGTNSKLMLSITAEVAALLWDLVLPCLRIFSFFFLMNVIDSIFEPLSGLHISFRFYFHHLSCIRSSAPCLFKLWVVVTGLSDRGWSFRSKFLPLSLNFFTHWYTLLMSIVSSL